MMLMELFGRILRLSVYGTIAGLGAWLISLLVDRVRAPKWISLILWGMAALRLTLPFSPSSGVSLYQVGGLEARIEDTLNFDRAYGAGALTAQKGEKEYQGDLEKGIPDAADYGQLSTGQVMDGALWELICFGASVLWAAGVLLLWLWGAVSYISLKRRLRFAMKCGDSVYETDEIVSPCVAGILMPKIYLTPGLSGKQREHIILHEKMHIRYLDHIWKILSFFVISLHWFNPCLWFLWNYFQGELEKACDERVLRKIGVENKEDYSQSLLAMALVKAGDKGWKLSAPIAFGEEDTKGRIRRILAYRKPLAMVSVLVIILGVGVWGILFTMPDKTPARPDSDAGADRQGLEDMQGTEGTQRAGDMQGTEGMQRAGDMQGTEGMQRAEDMQGTDGEGIQTSGSGENEGKEASEDVFEEISDGDFTYQARSGGIYRISGDGIGEQIYKGFPGVSLQMSVFEGRLYFLTDKLYEEGALDWADNTIRWVDLQTLETGDLVLGRENPLISDFRVYDGILVVEYAVPEGVEEMMLYHEGETAMDGKKITDLSDQEARQLGMEMTDFILSHQGTLVNVSHRVPGRNIAYLDMDGDKRVEKIVLEPSEGEYEPNWVLEFFLLQIGEAAVKGYSYNLANTLWAWSPDGERIYLLIYEDGPSADPYSHFYQYQDGTIMEVGGFEADIRNCVFRQDGTISGALLKEIIQTDWIEVRWQIGDNGMLEEIPQETYDFISGNEIELLVELPLYPEIGAQETVFIEPQMIKALKTSADFNWILIETQSGEQGWVHVENYEVPELGKNVMEVFAGRYLAG